MQGWIKLHRSMALHDLWLAEPFSRGQAWVDMLMLANHTDGFIRVNGEKILIQRGQLGWSERKLAERWQWSRGKLRRFFDELKSDHQIVPQKTRRNPIITLINYDMFQGDSTTDSTSERPQKDHRQYPKKNEKNEKNEKKGSRLPKEWQLEEQNIQHALSKGFKNGQIQELGESFKDYWLADSSSKAIKKDWDAAFRTWVRNAIKFQGGNNDDIGERIR